MTHTWMPPLRRPSVRSARLGLSRPAGSPSLAPDGPIPTVKSRRPRLRGERMRAAHRRYELEAERVGTGSSPGSRTTSLARPRIVVVQGATNARRSRGIAASRDRTTTGRRPISARTPRVAFRCLSCGLADPTEFSSRAVARTIGTERAFGEGRRRCPYGSAADYSAEGLPPPRFRRSGRGVRGSPWSRLPRRADSRG